MVAKYTSPRAVTSVSALTNALFLDFDGTLAPLQDDPDTVTLPDGGAEILLSLNTAFDGALVLISGRDIRDLSARTPQALWRAGGHGLDVCAPGQEPVPESQAIAPEVRARIDAIVTPFAGVRVEDKGPVLAIHYRQNAAAEGDLLTRISAVAAEMPGYKSQHGKMVIELKPIAANKGRALASMMQDLPFRGREPIMVGDDTTDEDAMRAASELGGYGIKVGQGETCAGLRLKDTNAVWDWLRSIADEHA